MRHRIYLHCLSGRSQTDQFTIYICRVRGDGPPSDMTLDQNSQVTYLGLTSQVRGLPTIGAYLLNIARFSHEQHSAHLCIPVKTSRASLSPNTSHTRSNTWSARCAHAAARISSCELRPQRYIVQGNTAKRTWLPKGQGSLSP